MLSPLASSDAFPSLAIADKQQQQLSKMDNTEMFGASQINNLDINKRYIEQLIDINAAQYADNDDESIFDTEAFMNDSVQSNQNEVLLGTIKLSDDNIKSLSLMAAVEIDDSDGQKQTVEFPMMISMY